MTRIAIMQPYFVPYAGYFRLFAEADLFVIFDCVQFPRRGYVHRNQLPDGQGRAKWLTLPVMPAPRSAAIRALEFADDAVQKFAVARRKFPSLREVPEAWEALFAEMQGPLVPWLASSLELCCGALELDCPTILSSTLDIPAHHTGQDRIIEICKTLGATSYLNAPGGRNMYTHEAFRREGIELSFLPPYAGSTWSVLFDLLADKDSSVAANMHQVPNSDRKGHT
jgi:hypothetical protein